MGVQGEHYTVLARRFRPQTFDEVVGQEHVARALRNAIRSGRVAHAYLFAGARGVGKTSMARILAKALNCPNVRDGVPCNQCEICESIASGSDVDVLEIDGASNRGIDDIRALRANVSIKSMRSNYKIYIIDEVHMLTKEAFNALLKTLEEPPPNVKFVFCTTEPNKVPDTILSRCQRFDFASISSRNIAERLRQIAQVEGVEVEPEALEVVARRAAGSMRDSQSLFDQLLAFGGERITADDAHRLFGTAPDELLVDLVGHLIDRQPLQALQRLDQTLQTGTQVGELAEQLVYYFRDLMVLACGGRQTELQSVAESHRAELAAHADRCGLKRAVASLEILAEATSRIRRSTSPRPLLELALVRIATLEDLDALDALIHGLQSGELAQRLSVVSLSDASARATSGQQPSGDVSAPTAPHAETRDHSAGASGRAATTGSASRSPTSASSTADPADRPTSFRTAARVATKPTGRDEASDNQSGPVSGQPSGASEEDTAEEESSSVVELEPGQEDAVFSQLLRSVEPKIRHHLGYAQGAAIRGPNVLEISFPKGYHFSKQYCERAENRRAIEQAVSEIVGRGVRLELRVQEGAGPAASDTMLRNAAARRRLAEEVQDPYVRKVMELFRASVARVEPVAAPNVGTHGAELEGEEDGTEADDETDAV